MRKLNDSFWYPNFILPVMGSFLVVVVPETYMVDLEVGYVFYNFRIFFYVGQVLWIGIGTLSSG